jgi:hypothetical protein
MIAAMQFEEWENSSGRLSGGVGLMKQKLKLQPDVIYVIECWATWCPPCRHSVPQLTEVRRHRSPSLDQSLSRLSRIRDATSPRASSSSASLPKRMRDL